MDKEKSHVLIFGGGSGLGKEIYNIEKSAPNIVFSSKYSANENYRYCDFKNFDEEKFIKEIDKIDIKKVYFCSVMTTFKSFELYDTVDINNEINFNVIVPIKIINILLKKEIKPEIIYVLSHICFLFNPGFTLYRMCKKSMEEFLLAIEIECKDLQIKRVYPGSIDTKFCHNSNYNGKHFFIPKTVNYWAKKIVFSSNKSIISYKDLILQILDKIMPFQLKKSFYNLIF